MKTLRGRFVSLCLCFHARVKNPTVLERSRGGEEPSVSARHYPAGVKGQLRGAGERDRVTYRDEIKDKYNNIKASVSGGNVASLTGLLICVFSCSRNRKRKTKRA